MLHLILKFFLLLLSPFEIVGDIMSSEPGIVHLTLIWMLFGSCIAYSLGLVCQAVDITPSPFVIGSLTSVIACICPSLCLIAFINMFNPTGTPLYFHTIIAHSVLSGIGIICSLGYSLIRPCVMDLSTTAVLGAEVTADIAMAIIPTVCIIHCVKEFCEEWIPRGVRSFGGIIGPPLITILNWLVNNSFR